MHVKPEQVFRPEQIYSVATFDTCFDGKTQFKIETVTQLLEFHARSDHQILFLLAVSFTAVCLRLAFIFMLG